MWCLLLHTLQCVIGFKNSQLISKNNSKDIISNIIPNDLKEFGLIPEILGRLPILTYMLELDSKTLRKILTDPKNALTKQYIKLFEMDNIKLEFSDDALDEIVKKAVDYKLGARGLRSILENILLKTMFELPDMENVIKVTVDKSSVKGDSEPIVTYGKKSSTSVA